MVKATVHKAHKSKKCHKLKRVNSLQQVCFEPPTQKKEDKISVPLSCYDYTKCFIFWGKWLSQAVSASQKHFTEMNKTNSLWDVVQLCLRFQIWLCRIITGTLVLQNHFIYLFKCAAVWCTLLWRSAVQIWMNTKVFCFFFFKYSLFVVQLRRPLSAALYVRKSARPLRGGAPLVNFTFHKWANHSKAVGVERVLWFSVQLWRFLLQVRVASARQSFSACQTRQVNASLDRPWLCYTDGKQTWSAEALWFAFSFSVSDSTFCFPTLSFSMEENEWLHYN